MHRATLLLTATMFLVARGAAAFTANELLAMPMNDWDFRGCTARSGDPVDYQVVDSKENVAAIFYGSTKGAYCCGAPSFPLGSNEGSYCASEGEGMVLESDNCDEKMDPGCNEDYAVVGQVAAIGSIEGTSFEVLVMMKDYHHWARVFHFEETTDTNSVYLASYGTSSGFIFEVHDTSQSTHTISSSNNGFFELGKWVHCVVTVGAGASPTYTVYKNVHKFMEAANKATLEPVIRGNNKFGRSNNFDTRDERNFRGTIGLVRVWKHYCLTASDVAAL